MVPLRCLASANTLLLDNSVLHVQWNLSYTDPMGPALVCITETSIEVKQYIFNGNSQLIIVNLVHIIRAAK